MEIITESVGALGLLLMVIICGFVLFGLLLRSLGVGKLLTSWEDKYDREHNIAKPETLNEWIARRQLEGDSKQGTLLIIGMPDKDNKEIPYIRL